MLYWFTSLLFGLWLCPLQNITKLCLENSRQKFSLTKNSLQNLTYFQNVILNPSWYHNHMAIFVIVHLSTQIYQKTYQNFTICCITLFQIVHINYARQMNSDQLLLHMNKKLLTIDYLHDHVRPCIQVGMQNVKLTFLSTVQPSTQPSKHQACAWYLYCMWQGCIFFNEL